jgi:small subunit ribosomal protein S9
MPEKKTMTIKEKAAKKPAVKKAPAVKKTAAAKKADKAEVADKPLKKAPAAGSFVAAMGKRKNATASVRMFAKGDGAIMVNGLAFDKYFDTASQVRVVESPVKQVGLKDLSFTVLVKGGGKNGQADAVRLGIAKALIKFNPELRPSLKAKGWLTRDPRVKERKKPGLKRARRAPQWSKR